MSAQLFYVLPSYAPDGSQGLQLREYRDGHVSYGWLTPATPSADDPTEVWRTMDAGPWITVGHGDVFEVAAQLGYLPFESSELAKPSHTNA